MRHTGEVPRTMEELTALAGVGRKTANVVLSVAFGLPGLPVDTHVTRLSRRLGLSGSSDPVSDRDRTCADCSLPTLGCDQPPAHSPWPAASATRGTLAVGSASWPTFVPREANSDPRGWRATPAALLASPGRRRDARPGKVRVPCESRDRFVTSGHIPRAGANLVERNRSPPPGSNEWTRDPPPDPLPDGALRAPSARPGRLSAPHLLLASMRSRRRTAPRRARSTAMRFAATSSRLAAVAASASAVTRRLICSTEDAIEDSSDNSDGSGCCDAIAPSSPIEHDDRGMFPEGPVRCSYARTSRPSWSRTRLPRHPATTEPRG